MRRKKEETQVKASDEERGREAYEREAAHWPSPIGWDNLPHFSKIQWIERAKGAKR